MNEYTEHIQARKQVKESQIMQTRQLETLAASQHDIWAHWMDYLFDVSVRNADGSVTIPVDKVTRWERQMHTPYAELSGGEKDSDRNEARKIKAALNADGFSIV